MRFSCYAVHCDIHQVTIATEPDQGEFGWKIIGYASLQTSDPVSQTAVDIPTAYCHDHRCIVPIARFAFRRRVRAAGGSGKWPTQQASQKEGPKRPRQTRPRGRCLGTLAPSNIGPTPHSAPNRDHGGRGPPPRESGAGHADVKAGRAGWVPRTGSARAWVSSGACSVPGAAAPQILRVRLPAEKSMWPVVEHQSTKGSGGPRGQRGLTRGGRWEFWLAISEAILWGDWQPSAAR